VYKCSACGYNSAPGEPQRRHIVQRDVPDRLGIGTRKEIVAEMPVCHNCYRLLQEGESFGNLYLRYHRWTAVDTVITPKVAKGLLAK